MLGVYPRKGGCASNSFARFELMHRRRPFLVFGTVALYILGCTAEAAQRVASEPHPTWLWVKDWHSEIGIAGASVEIGPGSMCLGQTKLADVKWTAHYVTGPAGRVKTNGIPQTFSCSVTLGGRALQVVSGSYSPALPGIIPKWAHLRHASEATIWVNMNNRDVEGEDLDYWRTTVDPTRFHAYIQNLDSGELISGVRVTAPPSGIVATSDANGLFTLEVPASYRKGKSPPTATVTLVFSKPGYCRFEYRQLVLNPGVNSLDIFLEEGTGTVVRKNRSLSNRGGWVGDEFLMLGESAGEESDGAHGEVFLLDIEPSSYQGGWMKCTRRGAKAVVKGRNLKSVEIYWYSTGTGMGLYPPGKAGPMRKVKTSPQEDTWELELPDLMTTDFWAQAIDVNGKTIKSMDLGNVGCNIEH